ncbi:hypothetical protein [Salmonella enterica]|nr:hypothetical protein [Salmonella enterica]
MQSRLYDASLYQGKQCVLHISPRRMAH